MAPIKPKPKPKTPVAIDCTMQQLRDNLAKAIANGADELNVCISLYDQNLDPDSFQAIVRFSKRTRPYAVVVHKDMLTALCKVVEQAAGMPDPLQQQRSLTVKTNAASKDSAGILQKPTVGRIKRPKSLRRTKA